MMQWLRLFIKLYNLMLLTSDPRFHSTLKFEEGLEECRNHLPKELIEQCRLYYDKKINLLTSVDGPCIIHRDFRSGNAIIDNGLY